MKKSPLVRRINSQQMAHHPSKAHSNDMLDLIWEEQRFTVQPDAFEPWWHAIILDGLDQLRQSSVSASLLLFWV